MILFPIWACMALVTLVLTQASLGPGYSIPHLGLTLSRDLWSHSGPQTKLVTLVPPLGLTLFFYFLIFFKDFIYLFMIVTEREGEAETQAEGEAGSMQGA